MASGYTAKTVKTLRLIKGTLLKKIQAEFGLIDAQLDIAMQNQAMTVGPLAVSGASTWYVYMPCKCDIVGITAVNDVALTAATLITASVMANIHAMTDGSLNLASTTDASLNGAVVQVTPTAYNEVAADASISLASDGGTASGDVYFTITFTPKA